MLLTMRMFLIIEEVKKRNPDGSLIDLDQLIERVGYDVTKQAIQHTLRYIRDSAANLGINCFIQNTKKLKQPSLMLLNTRYEALAAKFECVDTFEF